MIGNDYLEFRTHKQPPYADYPDGRKPMTHRRRTQGAAADDCPRTNVRSKNRIDDVRLFDRLNSLDSVHAADTLGKIRIDGLNPVDKWFQIRINHLDLFFLEAPDDVPLSAALDAACQKTCVSAPAASRTAATLRAEKKISGIENQCRRRQLMVRYRQIFLDLIHFLHMPIRQNRPGRPRTPCCNALKSSLPEC